MTRRHAIACWAIGTVLLAAEFTYGEKSSHPHFWLLSALYVAAVGFLVAAFIWLVRSDPPQQ